MAKRILFIGGSPCSGKSTVAERLAGEFGAHYFKVDDYLGEFLKKATEDGLPACKGISAMTPDEIWLREPQVQCGEEFLIYDEIAEQIFERLGSIEAELIVTEAAAFTPHILAKYGEREYVCIVPTPEFQISRYKEREWVKSVLEGCSDRQLAFDNWMKRDILFAEQVRAECEQSGIPCIVNDGSLSIDELYTAVKKLFRL